MQYIEIENELIGKIRVVSDGEHILHVHLSDEEWETFLKQNGSVSNDLTPLLEEAKKQFDEYFAGTRTAFELPLKPQGTHFQQAVWSALMEIPYGRTWSYSDLAGKIDNPKAVRAVGQANRSNRLPIIIPCHRVIGKNKSLTGYAGARTDLKEKLLKLEGFLD